MIVARLRKAYVATNRCDRDVGLAESGYDRCVPTGRGLRLFRNSSA
jgi:hypothetical protein